MKMSFIIPVYHVDLRQLDACIDSIEVAAGAPGAITREDGSYEVIVVFDGAPPQGESARRRIESAHGAAVRVFFQEHAGVSAARNFGIQMARGEWVCFVDADDRVTPDACAPPDSLLLQSPDIIFFDHSRKYQEKTMPIHYWAVHAQDHNDSWIYLRAVLSPGSDQGTVWGKMFRRGFIEERHLAFPTEISVGEDQYFMVHAVLAAKKIVACDLRTYDYVFNPQSSVRSFNGRMRDNVDDSVSAILRTLKDDGLDPRSDAALAEIVDNFLLDRILFLTINYFFHPDAPSSVNNRYMYRQFLSSAPYCDALKTLTVSRALKNAMGLPVAKRIALLCIKYHCWWLVQAISSIRHRQLNAG